MKKTLFMTLTVIFAVLLLSSFTCSDGKVLADGTYNVKVTFDGGTGKAKILPDAILTVKGAEAYVTVTWSSKNYDYMLVDDIKYMNLTPGGNSTFTFPIKELGKTMDVVGDTIAMSRPKEIDYTVSFTLAE